MFVAGNISGHKDTFRQVNCMRSARRKVSFKNKTQVSREMTQTIVKLDQKKIVIVSTQQILHQHQTQNQRHPNLRTSDQALKGNKVIRNKACRVLKISLKLLSIHGKLKSI